MKNDSFSDRQALLPARASDMIAAFASVLEDHDAIYCSAPITSGQRALRWLLDEGKTSWHIDSATDPERKAFEAAVIDKNREHAREVVRKIRRSCNVPVIDPTALEASTGWTQPEWLQFWEAVIQRFAKRIVFIDGWEYSNGCSHEFLIAIRDGIPTFDESDAPLTATDGLGRIRSAIEELKVKGLRVTSLTQTLHELERTISLLPLRLSPS